MPTFDNAAPPSVPPRLAALYDFVGGRVAQLQAKYLANARGAAGELATLRRGVSAAAGADPATWQFTFDGLPRQYRGDDDRTTAEENAVHAALTLYALHQQSNSGTAMHKRGASFGRATSRLAKEAGEPGVLRRFHALGTASSFEETLHHARGLITQFRQKKIPLDYGQFAVDLACLQNVAAADGVRLNWGRDYYFSASTIERADSAETASNGDTE